MEHPAPRVTGINHLGPTNRPGNVLHYVGRWTIRKTSAHCHTCNLQTKVHCWAHTRPVARGSRTLRGIFSRHGIGDSAHTQGSVLIGTYVPHARWGTRQGTAFRQVGASLANCDQVGRTLISRPLRHQSSSKNTHGSLMQQSVLCTTSLVVPCSRSVVVLLLFCCCCCHCLPPFLSFFVLFLAFLFSCSFPLSLL